MARRKKVHPQVNPAPAIPLDRSHIIEDVGRAGELVGIEGRRGAFRIALEALNVNTGMEWVELFGPIGTGDHAFTAVRPDKIKKRRTRGRRSRSGT